MSPLQMLESRVLYSGSPSADPGLGIADPLQPDTAIQVDLYNKSSNPASGANRTAPGSPVDDGDGDPIDIIAVSNVMQFTAPGPGDTDGDYDLDDSDLGTLIASYTGPVGAAGGKTAADGDTDGDGDVDDTDLGTAFAGYTGPRQTVDLTSGVTQSGTIAPFAEFDHYEIDAEAGDKLFLSFYDSVSSSSFNPGIFITNPDGTLLTSLDGRSAGATFSDLLLRQTGTYGVWVRDLGFNNGGSYAFTPVLINGEAVQGSTALASGVTAGGSFTLGDIDTYTIQADAGDELFVSLGELNSSLHTGVFIYNPDGTLLNSVENISFGASFSNLTATQTGTYTIVVRDNGADDTGGYNITAVVVDEVVDGDNTALFSGVTAGGSFTLGDIDTYTIQADAGDELFVSLGELNSSLHTGVFIYNPDGTLLNSVENISFGASFTSLTAGQTGTYTIVVRDNGADDTGGYNITAVVIDEVVDGDNTVLFSGVEFGGGFELGDIDTYTISASAGDELAVNLTELNSSLHTGVFIYNPDSTLLASVDNISFSANLTGLELGTTGTYTIVVRDNGADDTGGYNITATVAGPGSVTGPVPDTAVALTSGNTVNALLNAAAVDTYSIQADVGDELFLSFLDGTSSGSFNPTITIYNPDGTVRASSPADSSGIEFSNLKIQQDGTYLIQIDETGDDATASYSLTADVVDEVVDSDNVALTSGTTINALLDAGDIDTFTIDADAGDELFLSFLDGSNSGSFDPGIFIYNPDGTLRTQVNASTAGIEFSDTKLTQTGTYTIVLRDQGANATSSYSLTAVVIDDVIDSDNTALTSGTTINALLDAGDIDTFTIEADAGDELFLSFLDGSNSGSFDPGIFIYNPDGTLRTRNLGSTAGIEFSDTKLTQTGTYTVVVRDLGANATSSYSLTAVVIDDVIDSDNTTLANGVIANALLDTADIDTYTLNATAGDVLTLSFNDGSSSGSFDPGIFIYNPDGTLRARNLGSTSGIDLNDINLTQTGLYTIVVRDQFSNNTGSYDLTAAWSA